MEGLVGPFLPKTIKFDSSLLAFVACVIAWSPFIRVAIVVILIAPVIVLFVIVVALIEVEFLVVCIYSSRSLKWIVSSFVSLSFDAKAAWASFFFCSVAPNTNVGVAPYQNLVHDHVFPGPSVVCTLIMKEMMKILPFLIMYELQNLLQLGLKG